MPGTAPCTPAEQALLLGLQRQALRYFLDNQTPGGLVRDRQRNHGPRRGGGVCSTAATGMGLIALALASAPPHRLLSPAEAILRVRAALETALHRLPHDRGVMPHFVAPRTLTPRGHDPASTIDSTWLIAGGLWAAAFLRDGGLERLAADLYGRVDWLSWTAPENSPAPLLRHGRGRDGRMFACAWDRLNGETVLMYVLAAGAAVGRRLPAESGRALRPFYGVVAGRRFNNADLGLFVFQYGLDLLDLAHRPSPVCAELFAEAGTAVDANYHACRAYAAEFVTYRRYWGLSAGDGPAGPPRGYAYRGYAPAGPVDGTAHLTATLASVAHRPGFVLENVAEAERDRALRPRGRYGFSPVNADRRWVGRHLIGIDAGAAVLALDNFLHAGRVRAAFARLACVPRGLDRLGFAPPAAERRAA
jgi:hypothetical protein